MIALPQLFRLEVWKTGARTSLTSNISLEVQRNVKLSSEECFVKNVAIVRAIQSASEPSVPFKAGAFRKRQQTISFYRTKVLLLGLTAFGSQKSVTVKVVLSTRFDIEPKEKCFDLKPGFKLH